MEIQSKEKVARKMLEGPRSDVGWHVTWACAGELQRKQMGCIYTTGRHSKDEGNQVTLQENRRNCRSSF